MPSPTSSPKAAPCSYEHGQFEEDAQDVTWTSLIPEGTIPPIELNADKMEKFRPLLAEFEYDLESGKTYIEQLGIDYPTVRDKR